MYNEGDWECDLGRSLGMRLGKAPGDEDVRGPWEKGVGEEPVNEGLEIRLGRTLEWG